MEAIADVREPPVVGRTYLVPCVRARWPNISGIEPEWVPVNGPPHDDRYILGFDAVHYHVDIRFMSKRSWDLAVRRFRRQVFKNSAMECLPFAYPIVGVVPFGESRSIHLQVAIERDIPLSLYYQVMRKRYQRDYSEWYDCTRPIARGRVELLGDAFADARLGPDLLCPHRGLSLAGIAPDDDGVVTCPGHGLRWRLSDGRLVRYPADAAEG